MYTTSLAFPNIFNIANNTVAVLQDNPAIVNRTRLLMLTDPTELYNNLDFGVGLKRYIWQYNGENVRAQMQDRIKEQLQIHEPYVSADATQFADKLLFTGSSNSTMQDYNQLDMTVSVVPIYGGTAEIVLNNSLTNLR